MIQARRQQTVLIALTLVLLVTLVASILWGGSIGISVQSLWDHLLAGDTGGHDATNSILWRIRLPRVLGACCVGAILGVVGAAYQSLFRNPLAEPYVIGVSSGAGIGGTLAIILGWGTVAGGLATMGLAAAGALVTLALVFALAGPKGASGTVRLLLSGVVIGALLSSLMSVLLLAAGHDTNQVLRWLLGSTTPMFWNRLAILAGLLALGSGILLWYARQLNAFAVDEQMAARLGIETHRVIPLVLATGAVMTGGAVGAVGIIGFLGLVAPHIARGLVGPDLRRSLPVSAISGAIILLVADLLAQKLIAGRELPVGAMTALIGAPALLWILRDRR